MKEQIKTDSKLKENIRKGVTILIVCSLVMVAPIFSILEFGQFFHASDSRSSAALPVMNQRAVDKTTLPAQLFQEPLVTVTFDDGFESVYKDAMPLLQRYGIRSTQYVLPGETKDQQYISWKQIQKMQDAGHEIACHSMTHPDLTTLSDADLDYQLRECKAELTNRNGTASTL